MLYISVNDFDVGEGLGSKGDQSAILDEGCTYAILSGISLYYYGLYVVKVCEGGLEKCVADPLF